MSSPLSLKQIEAVIKLPGFERYKHFIKRIADTEEVWGLYNEGWALAGDKEENKLFPIWPAKEYADLCIKGEWRDYIPKKINIDELCEDFIPDLQKESISLAVFYTPYDKGVTPSYKEFLEDLKRELANYE